ncbi:hypothetical protein V7S43_016012 [Phytophthora oleae]|uniref:Uncharacterized protein n=1 Tax=Phytophthora oleae TaxID=2107226 RepID=A0ABD3F0B4_9STRA
MLTVVILNAYTVHKRLWEKQERKHSYYTFLNKLHAQMIEVADDNFTETSHGAGNDSEPQLNVIAVVSSHMLVQTAEDRLNNGVQRLRQRRYKVCAYYKPKEKKREVLRRITVQLLRM